MQRSYSLYIQRTLHIIRISRSGSQLCDFLTACELPPRSGSVWCGLNLFLEAVVHKSRPIFLTSLL
jgi:hypothetical protein